MKVEVDMKIKILDGELKGREISEHMVCETEHKKTEIGFIEKLKICWQYVHPSIFCDYEEWYKKRKEIENEKIL